MNSDVAKNASPGISNLINGATTQGSQQLQQGLNSLFKQK
jgi:hypothetical protein